MREKELLQAAKANRLQMLYALLKAYPNINVDFPEEEYEDTALIYAINNNNLAMAQVLIDAGADVNWETSDNNTPLKIAIDKNNAELIQLLIQHGAIIPENFGAYNNSTQSSKLSPKVKQLLAHWDKLYQQNFFPYSKEVIPKPTIFITLKQVQISHQVARERAKKQLKNPTFKII